ncbi:MAG: glutamate-5-semialdehyde dehydrogenase [Candidatus Omnitrophica bacterium CG11_big_fil_rev_8_21_14_0_20_45_26]|uniref:Gamma-glutamyl phosphate reductase n=1 Tax=Candidatus Abzuiibacterium crystallinum TaxID=1974748 RepID=A0A2H0LLX6_9BACT|nr:MAG: glutamate-5-semialdehyde dehydrogenase [Candidatus Omnitrophica bacterium CG11_big_fil_rev_8_21_14_0_20_45_26]PIW64435.1 MAG: glutamate-5-semialdehyde dehydrogenase [Candidatus Omnitrophica bacterium CG12_big_fil_rev_8_21_14_0_65_45_16]
MTLLRTQMKQLAEAAHQSSFSLAQLDAKVKSKILREAAGSLKKNWKKIVNANMKDLRYADQAGLGSAMKDRLRLDKERVVKMADAAAEVAQLPDPIGRILAKWKRPNGIEISKVTVPLGVILIIYESRPNVTSECASLCFKSGNTVILRGGKEAFHSNRAIAAIYRQILKKHHLPQEAVTFIQTTDRSAIDNLLQMDRDINLVIPRGGEALIRRVAELSRIPVIKHYKGVCHVYIDREADLKKAFKIALNAKCQRVSVCNAMETLLVHQKAAPRFLPLFGEMLRAHHCEIRGDRLTRRFIPYAKQAKEADWYTEYLDDILSIRVVKDAAEAIRHINHYGSSHTDAIVTENKKTAKQFADQVDSSSVMINVSTRFSDGNEYGFGAEIGISTDKIHARGPMGLDGLTSYKYLVKGNGQIRQ